MLDADILSPLNTFASKEVLASFALSQLFDVAFNQSLAQIYRPSENSIAGIESLSNGSWRTLLVSDLMDVTACVAELGLLRRQQSPALYSSHEWLGASELFTDIALTSRPSLHLLPRAIVAVRVFQAILAATSERKY